MATNEEEAAQALKLQLELRRRRQQQQQQGSTTTPESSWFDTMRNAAVNAIPSAGRLASDIWNNPDPVGGMADYGLGAIESAAYPYRYGMDKLWKALGVPGSTPPELSPRGQRAMESGKSMIEAAKHPAVTASNDPAGTLFNLLTLGPGTTGKMLRYGREGLDTAKVTKAAEEASKYAHGETQAFPDKNIDVSTLPETVRRAAEANRYDPTLFPEHAAAHPGLETMTTRRMSTADLPTIANLRQELERVDRTGSAKVDSGLLRESKKAFDEAVSNITPEGSDLLQREREAYNQYAMTRSLSDMLTSGKLKSAITRSEAGTEVAKNALKALNKKGIRKGVSSDVANELQDIVAQAPKAGGQMTNIFTGALAALGSTGATSLLGYGPFTSALAAAAAGMTPLAGRAVYRAARSAKVVNSMEDLIREINNLPPDKRRLRIQQLSPSVQSALLSLGSTPNIKGGGGGY